MEFINVEKGFQTFGNILLGLSLKTNQKVLMKIDKQDGQSFQAEIGAFKNIYKS